MCAKCVSQYQQNLVPFINGRCKFLNQFIRSSCRNLLFLCVSIWPYLISSTAMGPAIFKGEHVQNPASNKKGFFFFPELKKRDTRWKRESLNYPRHGFGSRLFYNIPLFNFVFYTSIYPLHPHVNSISATKKLTFIANAKTLNKNTLKKYSVHI